MLVERATVIIDQAGKWRGDCIRFGIGANVGCIENPAV